MESAATWLIGRQPILDREERVWGYELLFRSADDPSMPDATRASADVILGALSGMGVEALLGGKRGFVNVGKELLHSDALLLLPPQWMVIELLESIEPDEALLARCRALRGAGFALALDDHRYDPRFEPIYPWVDLVKVDLTQFRPEELAAEVKRLRGFQPRLLAEKVETGEQFRACRDLGFDYFQGYHFARPALVERKKLPEGGSAMLRLMGLLQEDADTARVEAAFRQSPGLTYRLLVLVNSVAVGSRERIRSVRQAITLLGRRQLRRWVQLALFSADGAHGLDDPLLDAAAVRATFLEELCRLHPRLRGVADAPEQGFLVGILSLLGAVYAVDMQELVSQLHLADATVAALVKREGTLGELLRLAEHMERQELQAAWEQLGAMGISRARALEAQAAAFAWRGPAGAHAPPPGPAGDASRPSPRS
jgi:EAL and modified HD-GYP domain-containing signal transduction protein